MTRRTRGHVSIFATHSGIAGATFLLAAALALPAGALAAPSSNAAGNTAPNKAGAKAAKPAKPARADRAARATPSADKARKPEATARRAAAPAARTAALMSSTPIQAADMAETRLIDVYRLFGRGKTAEALEAAEKLVKDQPNFQLAQLVYADLLAARVSPSRSLSDAALVTKFRSSPVLGELHEESQRRLQSLRDKPPPGTLPSQFLTLSSRSRYAIAVDASKSRLYLIENTAKGSQVVADYYISVGKLGIGKLVEGDARTPLGVYHVTSNLDPKSLRDFYGAGALPINYPNPYDLRRGRTGGGIWLHGTPPQQFSRAPRATDGCIVMANTDLREIIRRIDVGATPVVIAPSLRWITPQQAQAEQASFNKVIDGWRDARSTGDEAKLQAFYAPEAQLAKPRANGTASARRAAEAAAARPRKVELKDLSLLHWKDTDEAMVVTFGEVAEGERTGRNRRQYWLLMGGEWKILQEDLTG